VDDCTTDANPDQRDTDLDGFGNACDADFDGSGFVDLHDLLAVERAQGARLGEPAYAADFDIDGDGAIGTRDRSEVSRRFASKPGPSGFECAGEAPCVAGHVSLDVVEEVLSRSVRLHWRAATSPTVFEIERRATGGAWSVAGRSWGGKREFVDSGPAGLGLDTGRYEYRVRGGGPWSPVMGISLAPECDGQPAPSPLLPVVEIVDHEPDGDHDGDDLRAALRTCSRLQGCVLRALPVVYEDVNVELAGNAGYDFSRGLVIEGYGSASVFRSRVYSQRDHDPALCPAGGAGLCYVPRPVFSILQLGATKLDGVRFRNFHIDGRKREQPDPGTRYVGWEHWGLATKSPVATRTNGGCVHGVTARELMTGGFTVRHGTGWIFEHSSASDLGCADDLTPCDALRATPEILTIPGLRADGFGFLTEIETTGTVMRRNRAVRATKYGLAAVFGAERFRIHDNLVASALAMGIQCNGCLRGSIDHNTIISMHQPTGRNASWPDGYLGEVGHGIQCSGTVTDLDVSDNAVIAGDGSGIRIVCSGPRISVQRNVVDGNCRKHGNSLLVVGAEDVSLLGNVVRDGGGRCQFSVSVDSARGVRIDGGSIDSGPPALAGLFVFGSALRPTTGLVLRDLHLEGRGATQSGVRLEPTSSGSAIYDSVCIAGYPNPLVDRSADGALRLADPAGACTP
jgi:hypothetical protein